MKITVTKTAAKGEATRGAKSLVRMDDFELNVWRNDNNELKKFELRTGKKTQVFDDPNPFINWGHVMNHVEIYLSDITNAAAQLASQPTLTKSQQYKLKKGTKNTL